jgi:hypothetical protein
MEINNVVRLYYVRFRSEEDSFNLIARATSARAAAQLMVDYYEFQTRDEWSFVGNPTASIIPDPCSQVTGAIGWGDMYETEEEVDLNDLEFPEDEEGEA